jgi:hypothetical protein
MWAMRWFQFSLLGLFGLLTCVAMGCAALVQASATWCSAVAIAVLIALLNSILGVVFRRGPTRAFWIGFMVFGWGSLAILFGTFFSISSPNSHGSAVLDGPLNALYGVIHNPRDWDLNNRPITVEPYVEPPEEPPAPVTWRDSTVMPSLPAITAPSPSPMPAPAEPSPMPAPAIPAPSLPAPPTFAPLAVAPLAPEYFKMTGSLLFVMLMAVIGGFLACALHATVESPQPASLGPAAGQS